MPDGETAGERGDSAKGQSPEAVVRGSLDAVHPDAIIGWAWNPSRPNSPLRVDIFVDGVLVLEGVLANKFRADLFKAGKGNGRHAFFVVPPESLRDGQVHEIAARIWGPLIELTGSPQSLRVAMREPDPALTSS